MKILAQYLNLTWMEENNFKSRKSIQVQKAINSDICMVLDECPKLTKDKILLKKAIRSFNKMG